MKNLIRIIIPLIAIIFSINSCNNDDNIKQKTPSELIIGKWKATKEYILCNNDTNITYNINCSDAIYKYEFYLEFKENGNIKFIDYKELYGNCELNDTIIGTWQYDNNRINIDWEFYEFEDQEIIIYSLNDNTMEIDGNFTNIFDSLNFCENNEILKDYITLEKL